MDGDDDKQDQAERDDRMHDEHQPMPGRCIRALDRALDQEWQRSPVVHRSRAKQSEQANNN